VAKRLPPGFQRIHGTIVGVNGVQVQLSVGRMTLSLQMSPTTVILQGTQPISPTLLQIGDRLEGMVKVDRQGVAKAYQLLLYRRTTRAGNRPSPLIAGDTASLAANPNVPSLLSDCGDAAYRPALALDSQQNLFAFWECYTYPDSSVIYYARRAVNAASWDAPQAMPFTGQRRRPAVVIDGNNQLHLIWDNDATLFYAGATVNGAQLTWSPTAQTIYGPVDGISNSAIAVTNYNQQIQVHVAWLEVEEVNTSLRYHVRYRQGPGSWLGPVTFFSGINVWAATHLTSDGQGRVAIVYTNWHTLSTSDIFYRGCNVAASGGSGSSASSWSGASDVSRGNGSPTQGVVVNNPFLSFDMAGNLHAVWEDSRTLYTTGESPTAFYSRKPANTEVWDSVVNLAASEPSGQLFVDGRYPAVAARASDQVRAVWYHRYQTSGTDYSQLHHTLWNGTQFREDVTFNANGQPLLSQPGRGDLTYDQLRELMGRLGVNMNLVQQADSLHAALDTSWANTLPIPEVHVVAGTGSCTPGQVQPYTKYEGIFPALQAGTSSPLTTAAPTPTSPSPYKSIPSSAAAALPRLACGGVPTTTAYPSTATPPNCSPMGKCSFGASAIGHCSATTPSQTTQQPNP
jgi:hypothetical protein